MSSGRDGGRLGRVVNAVVDLGDAWVGLLTLLAILALACCVCGVIGWHVTGG